MARSPLSTASDEELLRLTAVDPDAFGAFYDRYEAPLLGFLYRATARADIAADLTAEVFAAALQSARGFDPRLGSARAWLFGIARHELADTWRRGRVEDRARRSLEIEALVLSVSTSEPPFVHPSRLRSAGRERARAPVRGHNNDAKRDEAQAATTMVLTAAVTSSAISTTTM
jgi:DNA-directed RNA polymerase specialized sigma24 family protein